MKKRFTVDKAEWTSSREEFYKKECYNLSYINQDKLLVENQAVFIQNNKEKIHLIKPIKEKSFWFETWTSLKDYYKNE